MKRTYLPLIAAAAAAALVTACGQSEAPSLKARANAPLQTPDAKLETKADTAEANEALKERLARQEAATKLFEKSQPAPAPAPARAEPAVARPEPVAARAEPQRQPEMVKTAAAAPVHAPAPVHVAAPAKAAEVAPPKAAEAPKVEKPEPVRLASAAPTTIPAQPSTNALIAKLVSRVDPEFPREAVQAGAEKGSVKARMTLDGNGNVTRVEVVEANPRRLFDRAVVRALSQWRFNDGPSGRTVETEVDFKR